MPMYVCMYVYMYIVCMQALYVWYVCMYSMYVHVYLVCVCIYFLSTHIVYVCMYVLLCMATSGTGTSSTSAGNVNGGQLLRRANKTKLDKGKVA